MPRRKLRALPGGRRRASTQLAHLRVVAARHDDPPFGVDAVVAEEDTWLVLSSLADVLRPPGHSLRVMTEAWESKPETPGSVIVAGGRPGAPLKLLAVVHDVDDEPSWREEWVASALERIFRIVEEREIRSLALPLLGTKHGELAPARFLELLQDAVERAYGPTETAATDDGSPGFSLNRLWLELRGTQDPTILEASSWPTMPRDD